MSNSVDFDSVLDEIGAFGRFQKILYYSICIPIILTTCIGMSIVFSTAIPKSRCFIKSCDNDTDAKYQDAFSDGFANFTLAIDDTCSSHKFLNKSGLEFQCSAPNFDPDHDEKCSRLIYDKEYYGKTIVSDFDLSCGQEWKIPLVQSMSFVGIMISAMTFGLLADMYGRRHILMISLTITVFAGTVITFSRNYWVFLVFNTLGALGQAGCFQTGFILALESVGKSHRVFCGIVIEYFFVGGEVVVTLLAMAFGSWQWLTAFPCIFLGLLIFSWPIVPESPRWLLKMDPLKAEEAIMKMAKINKVPDIDLDIHRVSSDFRQTTSNQVSENLMDVIKSPTLLVRFANTAFCWITVTMVYYGLSLNATNLAGDPFTNFILVSLVEIPGYSLSYFTMERYGRRKSTAFSLVLGGVCCIISAITVNYEATEGFLKIVMTITFLLGKLGVTWTFGNIYIYTTELFPTSTRTACVGACSTCGRIGAIVSPYIAGLALTSPWLPMTIFGTLAFISGSLVYIFLPETLGQALPENIAEAANFRRRSLQAIDEATPLLTE